MTSTIAKTNSGSAISIMVTVPRMRAAIPRGRIFQRPPPRMASTAVRRSARSASTALFDIRFPSTSEIGVPWVVMLKSPESMPETQWKYRRGSGSSSPNASDFAPICSAVVPAQSSTGGAARQQVDDKEDETQQSQELKQARPPIKASAATKAPSVGQVGAQPDPAGSPSPVGRAQLRKPSGVR